jgi:hypothetical protein
MKEKRLDPQNILPKRVVDYVHEMGVRALDHLAENVKKSGPATVGEGAAPNAVETLVNDWKSMSKTEKEQFVDSVASSVIEVIAASAVLPVGIKLGKKAAKATKKMIKKRTKKLRKAAKAALAARKDRKAKKKKAA